MNQNILDSKMFFGITSWLITFMYDAHAQVSERWVVDASEGGGGII